MVFCELQQCSSAAVLWRSNLPLVTLPGSPWSVQARAAEMDSKQFVKLCRESGVIDARLSSTAADLAFIAKAQPLVGGRLSLGGRLLPLRRLWLLQADAAHPNAAFPAVPTAPPAVPTWLIQRCRFCRSSESSLLLCHLAPVLQGARKIGFQQFKAAVEQLAYEKGAPQGEGPPCPLASCPACHVSLWHHST